MNNDAGWCGSGGPWITPELSMQKVVWTETVVEGPTRFEGTLAQPPAVRDFYRDIAVLAMPAPAGNARIPDIRGKASFQTPAFSAATGQFSVAAGRSRHPAEAIVDLTERMGPDGKLAWDVPPASG